MVLDLEITAPNLAIFDPYKN